MKKKNLGVFFIAAFALCLFVFLTFIPSIYAEVETGFPEGGTEIPQVKTAVENIWATVIHIVQILAFAAIIFCGIRYMFASADQRADIKQGLIYIVIGSILVFCASTVVDIIVNATKQAKGSKVPQKPYEIVAKVAHNDYV